MRTITGEYRIDYYNKYGERLPSYAINADSLRLAHDVALDNMPDMASSYTIMRCIYNSLDKEGHDGSR